MYCNFITYKGTTREDKTMTCTEIFAQWGPLLRPLLGIAAIVGFAIVAMAMIWLWNYVSEKIGG